MRNAVVLAGALALVFVGLVLALITFVGALSPAQAALYSNLGFVWPGALALVFGQLGYAAVISSVLLASPLYHGCGVAGVTANETYGVILFSVWIIVFVAVLRQCLGGARLGVALAVSWVLPLWALLLTVALAVYGTPDGCAGATPDVVQLLDAFPAFSLLLFTGVYLLRLREQTARVRQRAFAVFWLLAFLALGIILYVGIGAVTAELGYVVLLGVAVTVLLAWCCANLARGDCMARCSRHYTAVWLVGGLVLGVLALVLFLGFNTGASWHAVWHLVGALAVYSLIAAVHWHGLTFD